MNELLSEDLLDLIASVMDSLRQRLFFLNLNEKAIRDRYKSIPFLIESLCLAEKHLKDKCVIRDLINLEYHFLKAVLENNAPLFYYEERVFDRLGIKRNRSRLSLPEKNRIAVQCAAQVLWHLEGKKIPTIKAR